LVSFVIGGVLAAPPSPSPTPEDGRPVQIEVPNMYEQCFTISQTPSPVLAAKGICDCFFKAAQGPESLNPANVTVPTVLDECLAFSDSFEEVADRLCTRRCEVMSSESSDSMELPVLSYGYGYGRRYYRGGFGRRFYGYPYGRRFYG